MGSTPSSPVLAEGFVLHGPGLRVHLGVLLVLHCRHRAGPAAHPAPSPSLAPGTWAWSFTCSTLTAPLRLPARHPQCAHVVLPGLRDQGGGGHGQDVPEYLPPLLRLMKHRMSKTRSRTTIALMKPMNQPSVAKPAGGSLTRPAEGRGGRRLRPSPGLNAGGPQGHCSRRTQAHSVSPQPWARTSLQALAPSPAHPQPGQAPTPGTRPTPGTPIPEIPHTRDCTGAAEDI